MLKSKNQKIILYLLSSDEPVPLSRLVERFGVSERTLRYNMDEIDDFLKRYGLRLERKTGKGLRIAIPQGYDIRTLAHTIESLTARELILDADEKRSYVISRLLMHGEPITIQQLADEIFVGRNTIVLLLDEATHWFAQYGMKLTRKTNYGLKVSYTSRSWRNGMVALLSGEDKNTWYYEIADRNDEQKFVLASQNGSAFILSCRDSSGSEKEIEGFHDIISSLERRQGRHLDELEYTAYVFQMKIVLDRAVQGSRFVLSDDYIDVISALPTYPAAKMLVRLLAKTFQLAVAPEEAAYLSMQMLSIEHMLQKSKREKDSAQIAYSIVEAVLAGSNMDPEKRRALLERTNLNILYAIKSCRSNKYTYNPLFLTLVKRHKQLFDEVRQACEAINVAYDVHLRDDEVALIASSFINDEAADVTRPSSPLLRVLVVCVNGIGTARMLSARLKMTFPDICIVGTCSIQELATCDQVADADLIISTVRTNGFYGVPLIVSTPLLDDESISAISRIINMKRLYSLPDTSHDSITIDLICEIIEKYAGSSWDQEAVRNELRLLFEFTAKRQ